jgi:hypothetical protein
MIAIMSAIIMFSIMFSPILARLGFGFSGIGWVLPDWPGF